MIYCLCNHTAQEHGLSDVEAETAVKERAACTKCDCTVYQWNPIGLEETDDAFYDSLFNIGRKDDDRLRG